MRRPSQVVRSIRSFATMSTPTKENDDAMAMAGNTGTAVDDVVASTRVKTPSSVRKVCFVRYPTFVLN